MAKITLGSWLTDARNKVGTVVLSKWRGINYMRALVTPSNPNTPAQIDVRNSLARCVELWQGTQAIMKLGWKYVASGKPYSGYNQFVSENRVDEQSQIAIDASPTTDVISVTAFGAAPGSLTQEIDVTFTVTPIPAGKKLQVFARKTSIDAEKTVITETFEIAAGQTSPQVLTMGLAATDYVLHGCFSDDTLNRTGKSISATATSQT